MSTTETTPRSQPRYGAVVLATVALVSWLLAADVLSSRVLLTGATAFAGTIIALTILSAHARSASRTAVRALPVGLSISAVVLAISTVSPESARVIAVSLIGIVGVVVPVMLLREVNRMRKSNPTVQWLYAAVSVYLLVGIAFSMLFALIGFFTDQGIFRNGKLLVDGTYADQLYFSFVTLSTTGYGDYTPANGLVRGLAVFEAIGGQLYLVVAVAAIVTALFSSQRSQS